MTYANLTTSLCRTFSASLILSAALVGCVSEDANQDGSGLTSAGLGQEEGRQRGDRPAPPPEDGEFDGEPNRDRPAPPPEDGRPAPPPEDGDRPAPPPEGEQGECRAQCSHRAHAAFERCVDAGREEAFCAGVAGHRLRECMEERCDPGARPGDEQEPPTCEDRCQRMGRHAFARCMDSDRGGDRALCARVARRVTQRCAETHCEADAEEALACEERCHEHARAMRDACVEETGDEEACGMRARQAAGACVAERCDDRPAPPQDGDLPAPPPEDGDRPAPPQDGDLSVCEQRCHEHARAMRDACVEETGDEEACGMRARQAAGACIADHCAP